MACNLHFALMVFVISKFKFAQMKISGSLWS